MAVPGRSTSWTEFERGQDSSVAMRFSHVSWLACDLLKALDL